MKKLKSQSIAAVFSDALAISESSLMSLRLQMAAEKAGMGDDDSYPLIPNLNDCTEGNVCTIPIHGLMVKRTMIYHGWSCSRIFIGSDQWAEIIEASILRQDIDTLILDFDTGGGQVAGTERLSDAIWKARQSGKNTIAVVNEFCASAGLWAASQCDRIVIPATGSIGSLGVYTMHFDDTKFMSEQWGIEKSVIYRGKYKAIDERPLDGDGKAELQRFIDGKYSLFVDAVARGRGLSPDEVMNSWGESQMFTGSEAVSNGLADELGTLQDVLESLSAGRCGRISMSEECPEDDDPEEGDPQAMKLNAQGQILDAAGKVVGAIADLGLDTATVQKHFAAQVKEAVDTAVEAANKANASAVADALKVASTRLDELVSAVGPEKAIAAFKAGDDVVKAKASIADELAEQLKAKEAEIAKLKEAAATPAAPKFAATDVKKTENSEDPDAAYADEFAKSSDGFPSLKAFAAYKRYQAAKA